MSRQWGVGKGTAARDNGRNCARISLAVMVEVMFVSLSVMYSTIRGLRLLSWLMVNYIFRDLLKEGVSFQGIYLLSVPFLCMH